MTLKVFTIPPSTSFLPDLAKGIFEIAGGMGPDLTRFRILLPTRRACRALREEFLNLSGGKPLLLPRMNPLGDIDQEELDLMISGTIEADAIDIIPPALSGLERQMILTRLVQAKNPDMRGEQCLSLARALGRLMDQVYTEDLDLADLPNLIDKGPLAAHWMQTVDFLTILSEAWPVILAQEGKIDASDRRNRLLKLMAEFWEENPPQTPIIAAGSTGSIPATGNLLRVIAGLPQGRVVLPGLDLDMEDEAWKHIGETSPQNTMKRLIARMELPRRQVKIWREAERIKSPRLDIARAATCPAEACDTYRIDADKLKAGLDNVSLLEADNARHEAQLIALAVRECLETPHHKAVIITPDRDLARRISASLKRWDIIVDDSAGLPLHMKSAGIYLQKILGAMAENFSPLALLDLLKTQILQLRFGADLIGKLETAALRGPRPAPGLMGLKKHIVDHKHAEELSIFIEELEAAFAPLQAFAEADHHFADLIRALVETAEHLAQDKEALWSTPDGESLALLLTELEILQAKLPIGDLVTHAGYLMQFMSERMVRSTYGTHPRITILGQIEARLIGADLMIMAGLNEGTWPPEPLVDPWMSRPMRARFKLPPVERQTGLSAHDFVQAFNAPRVILTRARKMDNAPAVPARWLERIFAILEQAKLDKSILSGQALWPQWLKQLDHADIVKPIPKPEPRPSLSVRPRSLGVTGIETLMKNPYQIYARYILDLKPLKAIDEDVTASKRGEFIHDILSRFIIENPVTLPADSEDILLGMGREKFAEMEQSSPSWHYWWPRFKNLVPAFIEEETRWRETSKVWHTEIKGGHKFTFNGVDFTLTAKADRIDLKNNIAAIIDYKTGSAPALKAVASGKAPQLPLEALLMSEGAFENTSVGAENILLNYWVLTGKRASPLEITTPNGKRNPVSTETLVQNAATGFKNLMTGFMTEITPYTPVILSGRLFDEEKSYQHLARTSEWGVETDADEEEAA